MAAAADVVIVVIVVTTKAARTATSVAAEVSTGCWLLNIGFAE